MRTTLSLGIVALLGLGLGACTKDKTSNTPDASTCVPTTCAAQGKNCGSIMDGCGAVILCGTCTVPDTCGGGGAGANVCGNGMCSSTNCVAESAACGQISDGCADVLDCGTCNAPAVCGGGGVANQCAVPTTPDAGTTQHDAGTTGLCDATCMQQAGAVCCETCGCSGATVRCEPQCESPYQWDCEMGCCFEYTNYTCQ